VLVNIEWETEETPQVIEKRKRARIIVFVLVLAIVGSIIYKNI